MKKEFMSIKFKLIAAFSSVSLLMLLVGLISTYTHQKSYADAAIKEAEYLASTMAYSIWEIHEERGAELLLEKDSQNYVIDLSKYQKRDIQIVDANKKIVADTVVEDIGKVLKDDPNNEVGMTLKDGVPRTYVETSEEYPDGIMLIAVPIMNEQTGKIAGALIYEYTPFYKELLSSAKTGGRVILTASLLSLLLSIVIGWFMALRISNPVNRLKDATLRIADGDYTAVVDMKSRDEIGILAAAFNRMAENLQETTNKYRALVEGTSDWVWWTP